MPLTGFQTKLARLLSVNRTPDSYLAGGAALHIEPNSTRYSNDLDYFHDSVERVASAYSADASLLKDHGCEVGLVINQPGYVRAVVRQNDSETKVEWAHDSSWRFLPVVAHADTGYQLHPIDLSTNKALALAGRDEPRDFLDILFVHEEVLPLGALCWAAVGKDPGFTPTSLLELLKRRGKYRQEDFRRLHLTEDVDLPRMKETWLAALESASEYVASLPPTDIGCLYYDRRQARFVAPDPADVSDNDDVVQHFGRPGGVLPRVIEDET